MTNDPSVGDVHTSVFLNAVEDKLDPVRAMCQCNKTGELFEIIGIKREGGDVVPLFLIPVGGAKTIVEGFTVLEDSPSEKNPFTNDLMLNTTEQLH